MSYRKFFISIKLIKTEVDYKEVRKAGEGKEKEEGWSSHSRPGIMVHHSCLCLRPNALGSPRPCTSPETTVQRKYISLSSFNLFFPQAFCHSKEKND